MPNGRPLTVLCLASYEKGAEFMRACKQQGCRVILLTTTALADAAWPHESLDQIFYMPDMYKRQDMLHGVSYMTRNEATDRIVALDDFDVETAAALREHLRVPGMGDTTARYFRDKLAMRIKAQEEGIKVPAFAHVLNYDRLREFMDQIPVPWVLKPRSEASSVGIKKIQSADELWAAIETLGDRQSFYLLEQYVAGDVYHIDAIVSDGEMVFAEVNRYARPLLDVTYQGGIFVSRTVPRGSPEQQALRELTGTLLHAFGLGRGATHTEFIKGYDGEFYFLETSARVGGANIAEMVEAATGVNLWREWAKIEITDGQEAYRLPGSRQDYAGILISLARQEWPDTSAYDDPEVVWRLHKRHHAGLIVASPSSERIDQLLEEYTRRFSTDFMAVLAAPDKPTS